MIETPSSVDAAVIQRTERERLEAERAEHFPEVDGALRAYESAVAARKAFLQTLLERDDAWAEADYTVGDVATNFIPGMTTMKHIIAFAMSVVTQGLTRSEYKPATFTDAKDAMKRYLALEAAATKLKLEDMFRSTEKGLADAEAELQTALEHVDTNSVLSMLELQEKILKENAA